MTEATPNIRNKRRIWLAVMFSLIMPGLGQVYCGRLTKGLVLNFLNILPLPIIIGLFSMSNSPALMPTTILLVLAGEIIWLIAIIDSVCIARHTKTDYELKEYNRWYVYALFVLIVTGGSIGSALYLRNQSLEAFRVPAASCYPTIVPGDRILANKGAYETSDPQRGDIVVFIYPENRRFNYIKRVVAIAGDTVQMKNNSLYVNGQVLEQTSMGRAILQQNKKEMEGDVFLEKNGEAEYRIFLADSDNDGKHETASFAQLQVPEHHCFVIGDNRNNSRDSRHFGPVHLGLIKGRADHLYWPVGSWRRFGRIK
ncbi:MAG: signal peptidase I [Planctomycetota bacterium]